MGVGVAALDLSGFGSPWGRSSLSLLNLVMMGLMGVETSFWVVFLKTLSEESLIALFHEGAHHDASPIVIFTPFANSLSLPL